MFLFVSHLVASTAPLTLLTYNTLIGISIENFSTKLTIFILVLTCILLYIEVVLTY
jgi:hypothetical protein